MTFVSFYCCCRRRFGGAQDAGVCDGYDDHRGQPGGVAGCGGRDSYGELEGTEENCVGAVSHMSLMCFWLVYFVGEFLVFLILHNFPLHLTVTLHIRLCKIGGVGVGFGRSCPLFVDLLYVAIDK